jgi:galactonate dehydratase
VERLPRALAEAHPVKVIPHNPLSPISTAACVQLDACIPNFALQEYTGESDPPKRDMAVQPLALKDGYLEVPDAPGLGVELNDTALARLTLREVVTEPADRDGSVQDWVDRRGKDLPPPAPPERRRPPRPGCP